MANHQKEEKPVGDKLPIIEITTTTPTNTPPNTTITEEERTNNNNRGNLRTDDLIEDNYGILFEFEEELGNPPNKSKYISEIEEDPLSGTESEGPASPHPPLSPQSHTQQQAFTPSQSIHNRKSPKPRKHLAASVPVAIPVRLSSINRPTWTDYYDDSDEESKQFVEPHELAAKTYREYYLKTGFELDVPTSQTKRIKSFI